MPGVGTLHCCRGGLEFLLSNVGGLIADGVIGARLRVDMLGFSGVDNDLRCSSKINVIEGQSSLFPWKSLKVFDLDRERSFERLIKIIWKGR